MQAHLRDAVTGVLSHVELRIQRPEDLPQPQPPRQMREQYEDAAAGGGNGGMPSGGAPNGAAAAGAGGRDRVAVSNPWAKTPRNAACPCGSGKKYKHCHGRL